MSCQASRLVVRAGAPLAVAAFVLATGCGRLGFELLPGPSGRGGAGGSSGGDASSAGSGGEASSNGGGGGDAAAGGSGGSTGGTGAASGGGADASVADGRASGGSAADAAVTDGPASGGSAADASLTDGRAPGSGGSLADAGRADGRATGGAAPDSGVRDAAIRDATMNMDAAADAIAPQLLADWCAELPELPLPPVLDGALDRGLAVRPITPVDWNAAGTPDATADYAIAWAPAGLYVFVAVHDPSVVPADPPDPTWYGDGVEVYVDSDGRYDASPAYDTAGTRQLIATAPGGSGPESRGEVYSGSVLGGAWAPSGFVSVRTADGYAVEAFVTAADLGLAEWSLVAGQTVGFDVGVNVSFPPGADAGAGTQGHRLGQYFLRVGPAPFAPPYYDVTAFCNPVLVAR